MAPEPRPPLLVTPRLLLALTAAAVVATLAALFLGEYEFEGTLPFVAGPLLGLVVAEVLVSVGRQQHVLVAVFAALFAAAGVVLAGVIDANDVEPIKTGVWVAAALAAAAAAWRGNRWG